MPTDATVASRLRLESEKVRSRTCCCAAPSAASTTPSSGSLEINTGLLASLALQAEQLKSVGGTLGVAEQTYQPAAPKCRHKLQPHGAQVMHQVFDGTQKAAGRASR